MEENAEKVNACCFCLTCTEMTEHLEKISIWASMNYWLKLRCFHMRLGSPKYWQWAGETIMEYLSEASSWHQLKFRGDMSILTVSKKMNELNLIRCQKVPKNPGSDWHEIKNGKVLLSSGRIAKLLPSWLTNTAKRHNQWQGVLGRLDWEGHFPTSITNSQPMGKVGMRFRPDQDRILSVRECARTQGWKRQKG